MKTVCGLHLKTVILYLLSYTPPNHLESSLYSPLEVFDRIESNIIDVNSQFTNASVILLRDFNSRTSLLSDFVDTDKYVSDTVLDKNAADALRTINYVIL